MAPFFTNDRGDPDPRPWWRGFLLCSEWEERNLAQLLHSTCLLLSPLRKTRGTCCSTTSLCFPTFISLFFCTMDWAINKRLFRAFSAFGQPKWALKLVYCKQPCLNMIGINPRIRLNGDLWRPRFHDSGEKSCMHQMIRYSLIYL